LAAIMTKGDEEATTVTPATPPTMTLDCDAGARGARSHNRLGF